MLCSSQHVLHRAQELVRTKDEGLRLQHHDREETWEFSDLLKFLFLLYFPHMANIICTEKASSKSQNIFQLYSLKSIQSYKKLPYFILLDPFFFLAAVTDRRLKPFEYIKERPF